MIWVLTGPECSGKSSLAAQLHAHLDWPLLPELARAYLDGRHAQSGSYCYRPSDLLNLASMQARAEGLTCNKGDAILDTDLLTLVVWWQEKFGPVPRQLSSQWHCQATRAICCASQTYPGSPTHSVKTHLIAIVCTRVMKPS
jgi:nicotinamide riboside kinase